MSSITFSGLASGLDTDSIIEALMEVEQAPIDSLENDISYYESETEAYAELDDLMTALLDAVEDMDTLKEISSMTANSSDESVLTATATSSAIAGNYNVEVLSLAEEQIDVSSEGFADTSTETLSGSLTIGDTTIDYSEVTLSELVSLINEEDTGVSASIINDGTENGYRLRLSGDEAGVTTEITGTGSIAMDTSTDGHTYAAVQAHIVVDNVDIYSNSNTISAAIPGVTLDLNSAEEGETITLQVESDTEEISATLDTFVTSYNAIIDWISDQSENDWGNDASIRGVKRKMQSFISTQVENSGSFSSLVSLGFETDYETGRISIDSSTLEDALAEDLDSVMELFAGTNSSDGIADIMGDFFDNKTDRYDGIYALRSEANDATIGRLNERIERLEARLEKREEYLREQYTALEEMVSELNNQMSYLSALES